ncbi:MAG: pirin family protein [Patescibacteria group bacterium]
MINVILPEHWGHMDFGWLNAKHLYSFGNYYDPNRMGFGPLRVVNHDIIAAGKGFDPHPHSNMEIVTIILEGELRHGDALGNYGVIKAGDVQRMSAGTGIVHFEINSGNTATRLFQIWIEPAEYHIEPSYEQKSFDRTQKRTVLVSPIQSENTLLIHQNATVTRYLLEKGEVWMTDEANDLCLLIGNGSLDYRDKLLPTGTAIEVSDGEALQPLTALEPTELYVIAF